ncbi:hypothetical protein QQ73_14735, partial [Candidatus Endoriftia persephone str. Guaymas]|nr:hypothetical protein [Candidatus Endoriftia persephone str. Guaymas]
DSEAGLILVGAPGYDDFRGAVYLFDLWGNQRGMIEGEAEGDRFGQSLASDHNLALIGASGYGNGEGSAYLYDLTNPY